MAKLSYTSVVALNDYTITDRIAELFKPYQEDLQGIQVILNPRNYNEEYPQQLFDDSDKIADKLKMPKGSFANNPQLTLEMAREMGKVFERNNVRKIQLHYPWAKSIDDMNWQSLALTINFGDKLGEYSNADEVHVNYHPHGAKVFDLSYVKNLSGNHRAVSQAKLQTDNLFSKWVKESLDSEVILTAENNPPYSPEKMPLTGKIGADNFSLIPGDFYGAEAICLDIAHADNMLNSLKLPEYQMPENVKWLIRQYEGIPDYCTSPDNFIRAWESPIFSELKTPIKWLHICDEPEVLGHVGAHIGDGKVNFKPWSDAIHKYVKGDIIATIEVEDAYKPEGLERSAKNDLPKLIEIFG